MASRGLAVGDHILGVASDFHADWCVGYGSLGRFQFVAASAVGKLHLRHGRPRDDAFAIRSAGPWLALAVSDGVGSREQSRYGATFTVEALSEQMLREILGVVSQSEPSGEKDSVDSKADGVKDSQQSRTGDQPPGRRLRRLFRRPTRRADETTASTQPLVSFDLPSLTGPPDGVKTSGTIRWSRPDSENEVVAAPPNAPIDHESFRDSIRRSFDRTRQNLAQFGEVRGLSLKDLHCTLLGLLINTQTGEVGAGHIGDGLVAIYDELGGAAPFLSAPTPGEVGEVYVLTQGDWEKHLVVHSLSQEEAKTVKAFYLMTDGVADDCTHPPPENIFQRWAMDIDRELRKAEPLPQTAARLLRWLASYEVKGSWDDRTLVVVLRKPTS